MELEAMVQLITMLYSWLWTDEDPQLPTGSFQHKILYFPINIATLRLLQNFLH